MGGGCLAVDAEIWKMEDLQNFGICVVDVPCRMLYLHARVFYNKLPLTLMIKSCQLGLFNRLLTVLGLFSDCKILERQLRWTNRFDSHLQGLPLPGWILSGSPTRDFT